MALALTGCASLLGLGPAPHLYRVTPKSTYPANLPHPAGQLLVDVPLAPLVRIAPELTWHHLVSTPPPVADPLLSRDGWNLSIVLHLDI